MTLANFMYHNPRQRDDTLSCMKTIRKYAKFPLLIPFLTPILHYLERNSFIASCVNHQSSEDVVEYVQNMLTSDSILRIKYYGISSAFTVCFFYAHLVSNRSQNFQIQRGRQKEGTEYRSLN